MPKLTLLDVVKAKKEYNAYYSAVTDYMVLSLGPLWDDSPVARRMFRDAMIRRRRRKNG